MIWTSAGGKATYLHPNIASQTRVGRLRSVTARMCRNVACPVGRTSDSADATSKRRFSSSEHVPLSAGQRRGVHENTVPPPPPVEPHMNNEGYSDSRPPACTSTICPSRAPFHARSTLNRKRAFSIMSPNGVARLLYLLVTTLPRKIVDDFLATVCSGSSVQGQAAASEPQQIKATSAMMTLTCPPILAAYRAAAPSAGLRHRACSLAR